MQKSNLQKKSSKKKPKIVQRYDKSITNLSSFDTNPKDHLSKNPHIIKIRPIIIIIIT
jgi:transposase-like protein